MYFLAFFPEFSCESWDWVAPMIIIVCCFPDDFILLFSSTKSHSFLRKLNFQKSKFQLIKTSIHFFFLAFFFLFYELFFLLFNFSLNSDLRLPSFNKAEFMEFVKVFHNTNPCNILSIFLPKYTKLIHFQIKENKFKSIKKYIIHKIAWNTLNTSIKSTKSGFLRSTYWPDVQRDCYCW